MIRLLLFCAFILTLTLDNVLYAATPESQPSSPETVSLGQLLKKMQVIKISPKPLPLELVLPDLNDRQVRVSDLKGKVLLLNFWASWCRECVEEMPSLEALHQKLKQQDFVLLGINLQEPATRVKRFYKRHQLSFTTLLDIKGTAGKKFFIRAIPTNIIVDKKGLMIGLALGSRKWNSDDSIELFNYLLNQPPN